MKSTLKSITASVALIAVFLLTSCNKGPKKGEDLKGKDAKELLAGKAEKRWKLSSGKDFLTMMCFSPEGKFRDQTDYKTTYTLEGPNIIIKDYKDLLFTIIEIGDKTMTLKSPEGNVLIYNETQELPVPGSSSGAAGKGGIDKKWITGTTNGTVWKGDKKEYTYTFMNDGRFYDSNTGYKEERWSWVDDKTIKIGNGEYKVVQLTSLFFDIEMFGSTLKLNYKGEAGTDGKLK
jgi:hypothetical protein